MDITESYTVDAVAPMGRYFRGGIYMVVIIEIECEEQKLNEGLRTRVD